MRQERPEPDEVLPVGLRRQPRQGRANERDEAFRRHKVAWLAVELVLAALLFAMLFSMAGCIIVQSVPDDRGRTPSAPVARIILEQRQALPK